MRKSMGKLKIIPTDRDRRIVALGKAIGFAPAQLARSIPPTGIDVQTLERLFDSELKTKPIPKTQVKSIALELIQLLVPWFDGFDIRLIDEATQLFLQHGPRSTVAENGRNRRTSGVTTLVAKYRTLRDDAKLAAETAQRIVSDIAALAHGGSALFAIAQPPEDRQLLEQGKRAAERTVREMETLANAFDRASRYHDPKKRSLSGRDRFFEDLTEIYLDAAPDGITVEQLRDAADLEALARAIEVVQAVLLPRANYAPLTDKPLRNKLRPILRSGIDRRIKSERDSPVYRRQRQA